MHEGSEDPETVTLTRAIINIPSVIGDRRKPNDQWDLLIDKDKKIGYIRVSGFNEHTADELKKALEQLKEDGGKGLILDLRDDPGGLLSSAVEVSDMFLDGAKSSAPRDGTPSPGAYVAQKDSSFEDSEFPMVVMVNQNSASASEIVAAALQDHKRASVVGQRSFGKGSVQNLIDLDGGNSILKLTVASYYRPSGENIHKFPHAKATDKWGVLPNPGMDVKLSQREWFNWYLARRDRDKEALARGHRKTGEPQPPAATDKTAAKNEKPPEKPDEKKAGPEKAKAKSKVARTPAGPFVDKQLDKALEVIRGRLAELKAKTAA